jgi:uncharacterized coiled-coil protein SlyX
MDTDQRLERLEKRLAELDALLARLVAVARAHPAGRVLLKMLGLG